MVFQYATDRGTLAVALSLKHTVLPTVLKSSEFWIFLVLHLCVNALFRLGYLSPENTGPKQDLGLDFNYVKVTTAITTFFEVFYANQCYARYVKLYEMTRTLLKGCAAYSHMLRVALKEKAPNHMRLSSRYCTLAFILHFMQMKDKVNESTLQELSRNRLLKSAEWEALKVHRSAHWSLHILGWANVVARDGCAVANDSRSPNGLTTHLMKLFDVMQSIDDTLALPVPFQYFHLLCKMVVGNILMWAYSMGCTDSYLATSAFIICTIIFLSMMRLSSALADPFGTDDVDFPMDRWFVESMERQADCMDASIADGGGKLEQLIQQETFSMCVDKRMTILGESPAGAERSGKNVYAEGGMYEPMGREFSALDKGPSTDRSCTNLCA